MAAEGPKLLRWPGSQSEIVFLSLRDATEPSPIVVKEYQHMLSSYIVQHTQKVAIGPLEYCGNAHRISMGKSTMYVSILVAIKSDRNFSFKGIILIIRFSIYDELGINYDRCNI
jgi:hypothetical protein